EVFFKCENFQKIGAFKARGAVHAVKNLLPEQLKNGVATHSSGNHAQALAYAANLVGCKAYIVMPKNSAQVKMQGVKRLGAEVIECDNNLEARESTLNEVVKKTGAFFIPPFDHEWIIAGQGTAAKELIEEIPGLDFIVAPCGGGGLLSGTALTAHIMNKEIKVIGAEPENVGDAAISFKTGNIEKNDPAKSTIADGLRTSLGEITIKCIREHVNQILTVSENEIIEAMKIIWSHLKITAEPSSVVPLAVLLKNKDLFKGKRTGIIISGGNVDFASIPFLSA
ncbi:MAG: threonine/serine dehydratase, partial [Bacteroidia bacterium]|nr:threonine/serine dehydratase [Bacteroidia bacterium]